MTLHPDLLGRDLYADLGVGADATPGQLRGAYRRLALALHPDRNPDPEAAIDAADWHITTHRARVGPATQTDLPW